MFCVTILMMKTGVVLVSLNLMHMKSLDFGADGVDGEAMILRPVPESTEEASLQDDSKNTRKTGTGEHNIVEGNMLIEKSRLLAGINSFFKKHSEESVCADINIVYSTVKAIKICLSGNAFDICYNK